MPGRVRRERLRPPAVTSASSAHPAAVLRSLELVPASVSSIRKRTRSPARAFAMELSSRSTSAKSLEAPSLIESPTTDLNVKSQRKILLALVEFEQVAKSGRFSHRLKRPKRGYLEG